MWTREDGTKHMKVLVMGTESFGEINKQEVTPGFGEYRATGIYRGSVFKDKTQICHGCITQNKQCGGGVVERSLREDVATR